MRGGSEVRCDVDRRVCVMRIGVCDADRRVCDWAVVCNINRCV